MIYIHYVLRDYILILSHDQVIQAAAETPAPVAAGATKGQDTETRKDKCVSSQRLKRLNYREPLRLLAFCKYMDEQYKGPSPSACEHGNKVSGMPLRFYIPFLFTTYS